MLHTFDSNQQHVLDQSSPVNSPPFSKTHSHLTAALHYADNGDNLSGQLKPAGQVTDLAGWAGGNEQPQQESYPEGNSWKFVQTCHSLHCVAFIDCIYRKSQRSIDPPSDWGPTSGNRPQYFQRPASDNNNAPWTHYRAFSAPETEHASSWNYDGEGHEALESSIAGTHAPHSFVGEIPRLLPLFPMVYHSQH